jgi:hypothetical protein
VKSHRPKNEHPGVPIELGADWAWLEGTFLKLPFFVLATKNRRGTDVVAIKGKTREGRQYSVRISRNVETPYPGPLSRRVHFALMALLSAQGRPWRNPVTFSWGELFRQMGLEKSGRGIAQCKEAIRATNRAVISATGIFDSRQTGGVVSAEVELHLYQEVAFAEWREHEGAAVLDVNRVWLADWYLQRLEENQRKVNVQLWQQFERRSTIASRLYELLLFYGPDLPELNYTTLAHLIPVKVERQRSVARRRLEPALNFLRMANVIRGYRWAESKSDPVGKLVLTRGEGARLVGGGGLALAGQEEESVVTEELELTPAELLVARFYQKWLDAQARPTGADIELAGKLIQEMGDEAAARLVEYVIPVLRAHWPEARTFAAIEKYIPEALKAEAAVQAREAKKRQAEAEVQKRHEEGKQQKARAEVVRLAWNSLSEEQREQVRCECSQKNPLVAGHESFIMNVWWTQQKGAASQQESLPITDPLRLFD